MEQILKFVEGGAEHKINGRYLGFSATSWEKIDRLWMGTGDKLETIKLIDAKSIDFTWINNLQQFDHWNIYGHSRTRKKLDNPSITKGPIAFFATLNSLPEPDITRLWRAAIIYLAREIKGPDPLLGLKQYRHLAHLLYSTGHIVGNRAAILMAEWEHNLLKHRTDIQWTLVNLDTLRVLKRVEWAWQTYLHPLVLPEFHDRLKNHIAETHTLCPAFEANVHTLTMMRGFLNRHFLFERDYRTPISQAVQLHGYLSQVCNHRELWAKLMGMSPSSGVQGVPFVRQAVGERLAALTNRNGLLFYQKDFP